MNEDVKDKIVKDTEKFKDNLRNFATTVLKPIIYHLG
jgi:hypothetical protein